MEGLRVYQWIKEIQNKLDELKGLNVEKEGGIGSLVKRTFDELPDELLKHNIECTYACQLTIFCSGFNKDIVFAEIHPKYRPDKRKWDGYGPYLESVTLKLIKDIPEGLKMSYASQWMDYNEAKENFKRLEKRQQELLEEYKENLAGMAKLQDIMFSESYNEETEKEVEELSEVLESLLLK